MAARGAGIGVVTPPPPAPRTIAVSGRVQAAPAVLLVIAVTGAGLAAVVATSLGLMPLFGQPELSADGYRATSGDLALAVRESLVIASASTVLAAVIGLFLATVLLGPRKGRAAMRTLAVVVVVVPHVVGAASVGLLLSGAGLVPRLLGVPDTAWPELVAGAWPVATVLEVAWKESAFVALVVVAATSRRHRELDETAAVLGARPWARWSRVFVPTAAPALAAASLIVFVYSVGSYEVPWLLGRSFPEPLPVMSYRLFGAIDLASRPEAAAAATVGAAVAVTAAVLALVAVPAVRRRSLPARSPR